MKPIGKKIIRLESVDSTNNYTANLVKEGNIDHGTVILAVEQYQGRGQRNAEWLANPGENLTMSIFLDRVNLSVDMQFKITKLIALSVADFLDGLGIESSIKWPNDIFIGNKKIAGILIENSLSSGLIRHSIVGIGLNVNQTSFGDLPATSICLERGGRLPIDDVLFSLIGKINGNLELINNSGRLDELYLNKLYLRSEPAIFEISSGQHEGIIEGVDEHGKLVVQIEGSSRPFDLNSIKFIRRIES